MTSALAERTTGDAEPQASSADTLRRSVVRHCESIFLAGMPEGRVHNRIKDPVLQKGDKTPCVLVCQGEMRTAAGRGTNLRDDNEYDIQVLVVRAATRSVDGASADAAQLAGWLEKLRKPFIAGLPPFPPPPGTCHLPSQILRIDPRIAARWTQQLDAAYFVIRLTLREPRS